MTIGPLGRIWILPAVAALLAAVLPGARAQDARADLRVYLLDRRVAASPADTAASLTGRYRNGRGETLLLARVAGDHSSGGSSVGMIRGLVGSPAFVEVFWNGDRGSAAAPAAGDRARDTLRQAHQGPYFTALLPESRIGEIVSAWITVRRGDSSWTSEEFQQPSAATEPDAAVLAAVDRTLRTIQDRVTQGTTFMMLNPQAVLLTSELAKLAPTGFMDDSGVFENDRQGCLGLSRAMENSVAFGEWGRVATLSLQCQPRVRSMESFRPEPAHPEVPTLDHQP